MRYWYRGKEVTAERAKIIWLASRSYDTANSRTRGSIWLEAHKPDGGKSGERNWLREAGIELDAALAAPPAGVKP